MFLLIFVTVNIKTVIL